MTEDKMTTVDPREVSELNTAIYNMQELVTKSYLSELTNCDIVGIPDELTQKDIGNLSCVYKINKLVYQKDENMIDKLSTIYNTAFNSMSTVAMIIKCNGKKTDFYLSVINKNGTDAALQGGALQGAITGNFPGSCIESLKKEEVRDLTNHFADNENVVSAISSIPSKRKKEKEKDELKTYTQGIENIIEALSGKVYTAVILADPVLPTDLDIIEAGYENLYTQLSPFSKSMHTFNESESIGLTKTESQSIANSINESMSLTNTNSTVSGWSTSKNRSSNKSKSKKKIISPFRKKNFSEGETEGYSEGKSGSISSAVAYGNVYGHGQTISDVNGSSEQKTEQYGRSLQITTENKTVQNMMKKIDDHLERIKACRVFGAFNCATYILSSNAETNSIVAANFNSIVRGDASSLQSSFINTWTNDDAVKNDTTEIKKYLSKFTHPSFVRKNDETENVTLSPASVITGDELSVQASFPKKSINGLTVIESAAFGRNILSKNCDAKTINLGKIYHMGKPDDTELDLNVESLAMHTFVTGSTGSGKSTTIYSMLDSLIETNANESGEKIKFLVIEPAKGEYKSRFGGYDSINVYGTNSNKTLLLRINPFSFPKDVHVLEHIDRLIEIFNVCWPMYAAMPAVLKDAVERAYIASGWNLETSKNKYENESNNQLFPSFTDVLEQINLVMDDSAYSADSKGDYKGALCTRVKSLTNGLYSQIFTNNELSEKELFDNNVIVDLSRTGSSETKALIMGILVMKLQEYRMSVATTQNCQLKHVTVLEEAHNILKRTSTEQSSEGSNLLGKSVEMLANSIAEMRTYGEGFIIADQAPGLMDLSVIRNTNTKIIMRLPDMEDRKLVGQAAGLNDEQIIELSRLETFVAAVYQNNWLEPVLCKIDTHFDKKIPEFLYVPQKAEQTDIEKIIKYLLCPLDKRKELDDKYINKLVKDVYHLPMSTKAKVDFIKYTKATDKDELQKLRGQVIYHIFNTETAFSSAKISENDIQSWYSDIKESLEPNIFEFDDEDQRKIVAVLAAEKFQHSDSPETKSLFTRLMDFV